MIFPLFRERTDYIILFLEEDTYDRLEAIVGFSFLMTNISMNFLLLSISIQISVHDFY
jgi:hypothetical protein